MNKLVKKLLIAIFITRPVIDLFWNKTIVFGLNTAGIISIIVIFLSLVYVLANKTILKKMNRIVSSSILLICLTTFSTLFNIESFSDLDFVLRLASSVCFLMVLVPRLSEKEFDTCLKGFMIFSIIPICLTYLQAMGFIEYTYWDYVNGIKIARGSGGYRQPSVLTRFCAFSILYGFYFLETQCKNVYKKLYIYIYIIMSLIAVFLSYHRTGYFLIILLTFVWFYLRYKRELGNYIVKVAGIGILILIVFVVLYAGGAFSIDLDTFRKMLSINNIFVVKDGKVDLILRGRGRIIGTLILGIKQNPIINTILGNGVGTNSVTGITINTADMDFIKVLWSYGVIGVFVWIYHLYAIRKSIQYAKKQESLSPRVRLAVCVFISLIIWGFTLEATFTPNIMYHVYVVCGYAYYEAKKLQRSSLASVK